MPLLCPADMWFVNRGAIEASDNEAQLAGVMAHELSHVALRHGTNQATKAIVAETGLGIFWRLFSETAQGGALLTTLGEFHRGRRSAPLFANGGKSQADVMGTQVLFDSGGTIRGPWRNFFEKLEAETKGKNPPEFLTDHPSPEHRVGPCR